MDLNGATMRSLVGGAAAANEVASDATVNAPDRNALERFFWNWK